MSFCITVTYCALSEAIAGKKTKFRVHKLMRIKINLSPGCHLVEKVEGPTRSFYGYSERLILKHNHKLPLLFCAMGPSENATS